MSDLLLQLSSIPNTRRMIKRLGLPLELAGEAVLNQVSWLSPTRWGFAAGAATVDLMSMVPISDPLWVHEPSSWWRAITVLAVQIVVLTAAARLAMRRLEPGGR